MRPYKIFVVGSIVLILIAIFFGVYVWAKLQNLNTETSLGLNPSVGSAPEVFEGNERLETQ